MRSGGAKTGIAVGSTPPDPMTPDLISRGRFGPARFEEDTMRPSIPRRSAFALCSAVWLSLSFGCSAPSPDGSREVTRYDAKTFFETETVFGASFSADGSKLLMTSDRTGVLNAYAQPVVGGAPEQITFSETDAVIARAFFPEDDRVVYTADEGGNELSHVYVTEAGGEPRDLTPGEGLRAVFRRFSRDGETLFLTTNERDPQADDLYAYDTDDFERRMVFQNPGGFSLGPVSGDGRYLALHRSRTNADGDLFLADLANGGEPEHITPHEGDVSYTAFAFAPDDRRLAYGTDAHGEFQQAWIYDPETGEHEVLITADWDVWTVSWSRGGRYRLSAVNRDASTEITILDTESDRPLDFPEITGDLTGAFVSPQETRLAFSVDSDSSPANLHVLELGTGEMRRLTDSLNPAVAREDLVDGEVVRYPSFDGLEIPGILYRPHPASADDPVPALVWVHGGPGGQSRHGYRAQIQHLVNHGYAVFAVNNRGSTGYGKTFFHLDDRRHGDVDLKDCVEARRYLAALDWVDGERIGIIGGSYGGYMVAAALAFEPEVFAVGVNIFGVTNWVRTLSSIPPWWGPAREALYAELGDPETDLDRLTAISPLFHAENIVRPMYVAQGANDPRVLQVESDEIVEAVRRNGVPVDYAIFPDEGHGFRRRENRIENSDRIARFLETHLRE